MDWKTRLNICLRSLLLQACWNEERMQNLGFAWCAEPWLSRLYKKGDPRLTEALRRHLEFFNTQPHMAGFILGTVCRMEETRALGEVPAERIRTIKAAMGSTLAAVGDALFWGTLKPLGAAAGLLTLLLLRALGAPEEGAVAGAAAACLGIFNVPALAARWRGLRLGYERGEGVVEELVRMDWQGGIRRLRRAGLALSAFAAFLLVRNVGAGEDAAFFAAALAACLGLKAMRLTQLEAYGALAACAAVAVLAGA